MSDLEKIGAHLSDELLIRLLSDELSVRALFRANSHLAKCWECRSRRERLEQVARKVVSYGKYVAGADGSEPPNDHDPFITRMEQAFKGFAVRPWWSRLTPNFRFVAVRKMNPVISSVAVLAFAAVLLVIIWQRNLPTVTASEFIARAIAADSHSSRLEESGVVYQKVRIRTAKGTMERAVYRDVAGHRKPREVKQTEEQARLEVQLAIAGIGWDNPLSSVNFKNWHDGQNNPEDKVKRNGDGLLTLTTTVSNGIVAEESLTVRENTFHPVERTVNFVDMGQVEIFEVNYAVLGWDAVNGDLFEPLPVESTLARTITHAAVPAPVVALTSGQLDEAELQARLVLNQLNAESSERLEIIRNPTGVEVRGIVPTEERKRELQARLQPLAHVVPSISSFQDVVTQSNSPSEISSVKSASIVAQQPGPIEDYFVSLGKNREEARRLAQELYANAVLAQQETNLIGGLVDRFHSGETLSEQGVTALRELLDRHQAKFLAALEGEEKVLAEAGIRQPPPQAYSRTPGRGVTAASAAEKNLSLCKELTSDGDTERRDVKELFAEVVESIAELRRIVL